MFYKYTIRGYLNNLEEYKKYLLKYKKIDYYRRITITNKLQYRINSIKEYLNIDIKKPRHKKLGTIIKSTLEYLED